MDDQDPAGAWRAAVRAVDSDRVETFDKPEALGCYFGDPSLRSAPETPGDQNRRDEP